MKIRRKQLCTALPALVLAALFISPPAAQAVVKRIPPEKFQVLDRSLDSMKLPYVISARTGIANYYANVRLPVGARIKNVNYLHRGWPGAGTILTLFRQKMGEEAE